MGSESEKLITKYDFLNYFRYPKSFGFLIDEEIDILLSENEEIDCSEDLEIDDYMSLLREIVESSDVLIKSNAFALNKIKDKKLIQKLKDRFKVPALSFYDHSMVRDDRTEEILQELNDKSKPSLFFYKPSLISNSLQIKPTAIFKHKNKIYLLDHYGSTSLKRESLATFIFYNHFITKYTDLKISQYLVSGLANKESPIANDFFLLIGNSLPFTSQKRKPESCLDKKIKNINTLFGLDIEYKDSVYERIHEINSEHYELINNDPGDLSEEEELIEPEKVIENLKAFLNEPNRKINFEQSVYFFLRQKGKIVPPSSKHYKLIFQKALPNFSYSSVIIPLDTSIHQIQKLGGTGVKVDKFLDGVSHMKYLSDLNQEQGYLVFSDAINKFKSIKNAKTKIYYDFESVSFPFSYFPNTKPYMQIVLQISLIKKIEDKETEVRNIIIDPLDLEIDSFKQIIDSIYLDEPDVIYIVYNQSFENTRLKEMAALINEDEYQFKVTHIIDRTIDLANGFTYNNAPRIIHTQLKGFHSIKKVNNMISSEKISEVTKIRKYSDLQKCQNGLMAQSLLLARALVENRDSDQINGEKNKKFMFQYCENDVRSMIAVEMYIEELISNNKYPLGNIEKYAEEKLNFRRKGVFR